MCRLVAELVVADLAGQIAVQPAALAALVGATIVAAEMEHQEMELVLMLQVPVAAAVPAIAAVAPLTAIATAAIN